VSITIYTIGDLAKRPDPSAEHDGEVPAPAILMRATLRRFATDKGRAEIFRRLDEGHPDITPDEFDHLTVAPDMDALLERMDREAGDGA
jgi:hypothetical protein